MLGSYHPRETGHIFTALVALLFVSNKGWVMFLIFDYILNV